MVDTPDSGPDDTKLTDSAEKAYAKATSDTPAPRKPTAKKAAARKTPAKKAAAKVAPFVDKPEPSAEPEALGDEPATAASEAAAPEPEVPASVEAADPVVAAPVTEAPAPEAQSEPEVTAKPADIAVKPARKPKAASRKAPVAKAKVPARAKPVSKPTSTKSAAAKPATKAKPVAKAKPVKKSAPKTAPVGSAKPAVAAKPAPKIASTPKAPLATAPEKAAAKTVTKNTTFAGIPTLPFWKETKMDMSATFGGFQEAISEAQTKAKDAFEKSQAMLGEVGDFTKGNVEAVIESGKIYAAGMQEMGSSLVAEGRSAFETMTADVKELAAAKSPTDFFKLQSEMMKKGLDSAMATGSKNSETMLKLMSDAMAPLSGRMSLAMEKARSVAI